MILVVDPHSGIPVYRQLVEQIRFNVASGVLKPGDEISSTRALSASLGVNPMTISKAFVILEQDDVLKRRPGRPHIVSESQGEEVLSNKHEQLEAALRPVVTKARQMGMDAETALEIFRNLLNEEVRKK